MSRALSRRTQGPAGPGGEAWRMTSTPPMPQTPPQPYAQYPQPPQPAGGRRGRTVAVVVVVVLAVLAAGLGTWWWTRDGDEGPLAGRPRVTDARAGMSYGIPEGWERNDKKGDLIGAFTSSIASKGKGFADSAEEGNEEEGGGVALAGRSVMVLDPRGAGSDASSRRGSGCGGGPARARSACCRRKALSAANPPRAGFDPG